MWAGDVTPEQALKQAQNFVQNQVTAGRRAPGATPQLALKGTVSGLYVFNVANDEGFVIVSNDDRTTPVLGYSSSGSLDPDNMPDNMRAWLQGYADEIAWMNEHNIQPASQSSSRRTSSSVKEPIAPMVETRWDQGAPYNNLTPYYRKIDGKYYYSTSYQDGYKHCATGCVATAMAQVMKYHQWPTSPTTNISEYTWQGNTLGPLSSSITFDWTSMQNTYSGEFTEAQANAVATLMQYCGYSVKMDYGPESGSNTQNVAAALKKYFGYEETTQYVSRSYYSYDKWVDLIYYEVAHNRPVVYGGASTGGGHEFVCDGYQYTDETDFFHINWGWGGKSDQYFVLSVLNPYEQGIGGSSTNDGFRYGQDAVIGIQPLNGGGTMSEITPNVVNLKLESITPSSSTIALGNSVDVTIRVTNKSDDVYDGEVWLAVNNALAIGDMFLIAKNETKDCNFTFTPDDNGTYTLRAAFPNGDGYYSLSSESATVTATEDPTPTNVAVSNVTPTSATVTWDGISESYNMRYRTARGIFYDFESAEPWVVDNFAPFTTYDGDGLDTYGIQGVTFENQTYTGSVIAFQNGTAENFTAHSGNAFGCFMDAVPDTKNGIYNNDWFITPEIVITEGMVFTFWARSATNQWGLERFKVGVYGNSNGTFSSYLAGSANTYVEAPVTWTQYSYDLSDYAGQTIKLAINCVSEDFFAFFIDDLFIGNPNDEEWDATITNATTPYELTGLSSETKYEVQVQANTSEGTSDWSSSATFTTAELIELLNDDKKAATKNTELIAAYDEVSTYVTLSGRTVAGNNQWNTFCLPFDISTSELATYLSTITSESVTVTARVLDKANTSLSNEGVLTLRLTDVTETIPAGTPFIMRCVTETESIDLSSHPISATIDGSETAIARMTQTSSDGNVMFVGQWSTFDITNDNINEIVYIGSDNKIGYSKSPRTLKCMRAHFWIQPKATGAPALTSIYVDFGDGETTSIDLTNADSNEQSTGWYTIDGVKLSGEPEQKGLYIYNGKKVIK